MTAPANQLAKKLLRSSTRLMEAGQQSLTSALLQMRLNAMKAERTLMEREEMIKKYKEEKVRTVEIEEELNLIMQNATSEDKKRLEQWLDLSTIDKKKSKTHAKPKMTGVFEKMDLDRLNSVRHNACSFDLNISSELQGLKDEMSIYCEQIGTEIRKLHAVRRVSPDTVLDIAVWIDEMHTAFKRAFNDFVNVQKDVHEIKYVDDLQMVTDNLNQYIDIFYINFKLMRLVTETPVLLPSTEGVLFNMRKITELLKAIEDEAYKPPISEKTREHEKLDDDDDTHGIKEEDFENTCYKIVVHTGSQNAEIKGDLKKFCVLLKLHAGKDQQPSTSYFDLNRSHSAELFQADTATTCSVNGRRLKDVQSIEIYHYDDCIKSWPLNKIEVFWDEDKESPKYAVFQIGKSVQPNEKNNSNSMIRCFFSASKDESSAEKSLVSSKDIDESIAKRKFKKNEPKEDKHRKKERKIQNPSFSPSKSSKQSKQ